MPIDKITIMIHRLVRLFLRRLHFTGYILNLYRFLIFIKEDHIVRRSCRL